MKCAAYRYQSGEQKPRPSSYHGAQREVGVTVLECELEAGHDGPHRCVWRGRLAYWPADGYR